MKFKYDLSKKKIKFFLGECENDSECSSSQACFNFKCKDACLDACGINAQCKALNHGAICSCPGKNPQKTLKKPLKNP